MSLLLRRRLQMISQLKDVDESRYWYVVGAYNNSAGTVTKNRYRIYQSSDWGETWHLGLVAYVSGSKWHHQPGSVGGDIRMSNLVADKEKIMWLTSSLRWSEHDPMYGSDSTGSGFVIRPYFACSTGSMGASAQSTNGIYYGFSSDVFTSLANIKLAYYDRKERKPSWKFCNSASLASIYTYFNQGALACSQDGKYLIAGRGDGNASGDYYGPVISTDFGRTLYDAQNATSQSFISQGAPTDAAVSKDGRVSILTTLKGFLISTNYMTSFTRVSSSISYTSVAMSEQGNLAYLAVSGSSIMTVVVVENDSYRTVTANSIYPWCRIRCSRDGTKILAFRFPGSQSNATINTNNVYRSSNFGETWEVCIPPTGSVKYFFPVEIAIN